MAEMTGVTPVYCTNCPTGVSGNDMATVAALMGNKDDAMWSNPFVYLIWMMFANRFFGGYGAAGEAASTSILSDKIDTLGSQMNTNQNTNLMMSAINGNHEALHALSAALGVDVATLTGAINNVQNAVTTVGGQVGMTGQQVINAVLLGNKDLTSALQSCCCENKMLSMQNTNAIMTQQSSIASQQQLQASQIAAGTTAAIEGVRQATINGFANIGYQNEANTSRIVEAGHADTQRILDTLNGHWTAELSQQLQNAKFENSQLKQNVYLGGLIQGQSTGVNPIW